MSHRRKEVQMKKKYHAIPFVWVHKIHLILHWNSYSQFWIDEYSENWHFAIFSDPRYRTEDMFVARCIIYQKLERIDVNFQNQAILR